MERLNVRAALDHAARSPGHPESGSGGEAGSVVDLVLLLWRRKMLIAAVTLAFMAGSLGVALLLRPSFDSTTTLMPIGQGSSPELGQYGKLAAGAGLPIGSSSSSASTEKIMAILESWTLCERVIEELDLVPVFVEHPERLKRPPLSVAVEELQRAVAVTDNERTGLITITVSLGEPALAQRVADKIVELLESTLNDYNRSLSARSARVLEEQLGEQAVKVQSLERALASFQRDTKIITPEGQIASAMSLYAGLLEQRIGYKVGLSRLESLLSSDNPQVTAAKAQLDAVNDQIRQIEGSAGLGALSMKNAPDQIIQFQTINRDLEIASRIYAVLLSNYENQKLQETQNQLFVEVIDKARLPDLKARPKRALIAIGGSLFGAFAGILLALAVDFSLNLGRAVRRKISASPKG